jgi:hypothetical protein
LTSNNALIVGFVPTESKRVIALLVVVERGSDVQCTFCSAL